jgi:hypothetical protein
MKIAKLTFFIALTAGAVTFAGGSDAGQSVFSFLKIGVSAKSQAMGGAFVGLADDISSLYCNPAGLTAPIYDLRKTTDYYYDEETADLPSTEKQRAVKPNKFTATYINYLLDFQTGYLGYVRYLDEKSSFGGSIQYLDYGTFTRLNNLGEDQGAFSAYDMAFSLTYSKRMTPELSLGATAKFILEKIDSYSSDALAVDLGGLYRFDRGRTSIGAVIMNLGAQLKGFTKTHKDPLPLLVDVGFSHSLKGVPLTVDIDVTYPTDNDLFFAIGAQWESFSPFFIRAGWSSMGKDYETGSDKDKFGGFAGGFGYSFKDYSLDYSYSSYADIGNVHRMTLGIDF